MGGDYFGYSSLMTSGPLYVFVGSIGDLCIFKR